MNDYFPRIVGNAFIARDGTPRKLSLLEQFYIRMGWLTVNKLQKRIDVAAGIRRDGEQGA